MIHDSGQLHTLIRFFIGVLVHFYFHQIISLEVDWGTRGQTSWLLPPWLLPGAWTVRVCIQESRRKSWLSDSQGPLFTLQTVCPVEEVVVSWSPPQTWRCDCMSGLSLLPSPASLLIWCVGSLRTGYSPGTLFQQRQLHLVACLKCRVPGPPHTQRTGPGASTLSPPDDFLHINTWKALLSREWISSHLENPTPCSCGAQSCSCFLSYPELCPVGCYTE